MDIASMFDPERLEEIRRLANMSLEEKVEDDKERLHEESQSTIKVLQPYMNQFFEKKKNATKTTSLFPAVDIGSSRAVGTINLALAFQGPMCNGDGLDFYPSDYSRDDEPAPVEAQTRSSLRYHVAREEKQEEPLCLGSENRPLYYGDLVELRGLTSAQFNGKRGRIQGPDKHAQGRFAVRLIPNNDRKSFKPENLHYFGAICPGDAYLRHLRIEKMAKDFFQGLLDRTREIDILKRTTWSSVEDLKGKCALVTCTCLLSCLGYRDPTAWQDTLTLASRLLQVDGYVLQYDAAGYAGFGDSTAMEAFVQEKELPLTLEENKQASVHKDSVFVIWRKV